MVMGKCFCHRVNTQVKRSFNHEHIRLQREIFLASTGSPVMGIAVSKGFLPTAWCARAGDAFREPSHDTDRRGGWILGS